jgi:hypothetical protein
MFQALAASAHCALSLPLGSALSVEMQLQALRLSAGRSGAQA